MPAAFALLEQIMHRSKDFMTVCDRKGNVLFANSAAYRLTGVGPAEMEGTPLEMHLAPSDRASFRNIVLPALWEHGSWVGSVGMVQIPSGAAIPLHAELCRLTESAGGAPSHFTFRGRDRRPEQTAQQGLEAIRLFHQRLLDSIPACVKVLDLAGNLVEMNGPGQSLLEIAELGPLLGTSWVKFWAESERPAAQAAINSALAGVMGEFEAPKTTASGEQKWWEVLVTTIPDAKGDPEKLLVISLDETEKKRAREELESNRRRRDALLVSGDVGTWAYQIAEDQVWADANVARLCNVTRDDAKGGPLEAYLRSVVAEDLPGLRAALAEATERRDLFQVEYRLRQGDGSIRHVLARGRVERNSEGRAVSLPGVMIDITEDVIERERVAEELALSEAKFRQLSNSIPQLAWMARPDGYIFWFNERWYEYTGTTLKEMEGEGWQAVHDPVALPRVLTRWRASVESGTPFDMTFPLRGADGIFRPFLTRVQPVRSSDGEVALWVGTNTDVTAQEEGRREVEELAERLRESEAQFRELADAMPQIVWAAQPDGMLDYYNARWFKFIGLPSDSGAAAAWDRYIHPADLPSAYEVWSESIGTLEPYTKEFRVRDRTGNYRWFLARALPIQDAEGAVKRWFGTCTDIQDRKELELQREHLLNSERSARNEAERANQMKDEFLATLSHELRTPLNAIFGWTQLIREDQNDPELVATGIEIIDRNVRAQNQLIEDLLDMSRIISGKLRIHVQSVSPAACIEAAIETVASSAEAKQIRLTRILDPLAGPISGDPARLQQIVWNLLSNAIKFTPKGGMVKVLLERINSHLEISVADSGQGISEDFLPHVFERFRQADAATTRQHGGLGLGLAIVKQLVELHGGSIRVESEGEDLGSVFVVSLPLKAIRQPTESARTHPAAPKPLPPLRESMQLTGLRVLVVDDEPDARELLRRVLEDRAATIFCAGSAAEALSTLQREIPDVLVTDIGMAGIDGYELLRQVRALANPAASSVPAIALTAFARSEDRTRALLAGFLAHVAKPVEPAELIATVAAVAGRNGGRGHDAVES